MLCGPSAGSLCWFEEALSAFHGAPRRVRGLGLLPHSNCVHYDAEHDRRPEYHRFVRDGMLSGFAVEDGVALHFRRSRLARVVSSRPDGHAYRVERCGRSVQETALDVAYLGARSQPPGTSTSEPSEPVLARAGGASRRQRRPALAGGARAAARRKAATAAPLPA